MMELPALAQWIAFAVLALIAIAGALGMTTTMSMFRSGIFLMASFIGVAGLFILLMADLLALLQVMMYIGGMLVMILFMLLFSSDPGGAMMSSHMKLRGPEKLFSLGLAHGMQQGGRQHQGRGSKQHGGHQQHGEHQEQQHGQGHQHGGGGGHGGMSMFTSAKRPAMVVAALVGALLVGLLLWQPAGWAVVERVPGQDSPNRIGHLLMGKYMIAFEGAGLLILLGIYGAVMCQRPARHPDPAERDRLRAAVDERPAPAVVEPLEPIHADLEPEDAYRSTAGSGPGDAGSEGEASEGEAP